MARTAEYSIKGYLYQFLRYLSEILAAEDGSKITIEGAIEDIDVITPSLTKAVQCKYHEQSEKFTLGKIYKPILLMLEHFSKNPAAIPEIDYRLFCYFPGENGNKILTQDELTAVLGTTSKPLMEIIKRIDPNVDKKAFLSRLTIEFGPRAEELQRTVLETFRAKGFSAEDIDAIIFPNAIQLIVDRATQSDIVDRTVEPRAFLDSLRDVRRVTFNRWTRELATKAQILKQLREDLSPSLNYNMRSRVFVMDSKIDKFDDDIVRFIKKFVERYSCKYLHANPPLFMIAGEYDVAALETRLHDAGLLCATGMVGSGFRSENLFRQPMRTKVPFKIEFKLRLANRAVVTGEPPKRPDELFLVNVADDAWERPDVAVHRFEIERLSDLEYPLKLRNDNA